MEKCDTRKNFIQQAIPLLNQGISKSEVARRMGVSRQTIHKWWSRHKQGTIEIPLPRGRKKGKHYKLTDADVEHIQKMIVGGFPDAYGLPFLLWNVRAVKTLIEKECNIVLSLPSVQTILSDWHFIPSKTKNRFLTPPQEVGYQGFTFNFSNKRTQNIPIYQYAKNNNLQLYLVDYYWDWKSILLAISKSGHIEFAFIYNHLPNQHDFLTRLKKKTRKRLLILTCHKTFSPRFSRECYRKNWNSDELYEILPGIFVELMT